MELWDTASHQEFRSRWTAQEHGLIISVAFSPNGKTLATVGDRGNVKLWDITLVISRQHKTIPQPDPVQTRVTVDGVVFALDAAGDAAEAP